MTSPAAPDSAPRPQPPAPAPGAALRAWLAATRPHTLSASAVPVLVGSALCVAQGAFRWELFALTLLGSLLVQIGANFTDEFADHGATASAHKFPAPHKVIARGLLSVRAVKWGAVVVFALATLIGLRLVAHGGWPLLAVCLLSLAVAYGYSAGPLPLGDVALGEVAVFVLMGPVMVLSTVYVQTLAWQWLALWYALPVGALVTAILIANNLRDAEEDRRNGRRTLVTLHGERVVRGLYGALLLLAYGVPPALWATAQAPLWVFLPWLTAPLAVRVLRLVRAGAAREQLHAALRGTSGLHLLYGLLLAAALLAQGVAG